MSRRQKIVVGVVFAVLVLLYTGVAAFGGRTGQGDASKPQGGLVGWIGGLVGKPPVAARSELRSDCLVDDTLTVKGSCVLTVAHSDRGTRRVSLHARDAVAVTSRAPNGDQSVHVDVKPDKDIDVTVDGKGGDITFDCADPGSTCLLTLA